LIVAGCSGSKATQRPSGVKSPTPIVREHQSKLSREREAASLDTADLRAEGHLVR